MRLAEKRRVLGEHIDQGWGGHFLSLASQSWVCFVHQSWAVVELVDAGHWVQQSHVLSTVERQTLSAVVVHHLWDAGEHAAALVKGVAVLFGLGDDYVNAALACPESCRRQERKDKNEHH